MEAIKRSKVLCTLWRVGMTLLGALISSISINALYVPNQIMSGGVTGIAIWSHLSFGLNTSLVIFVVNIPIFILGYKFIHRNFVIFSFIGMLSMSFFLELTKGINFHSSEMLTTILLGGFINGLGLGLILRVNSSTGGNDIISKILNKYFSYSISTLNFALNVIIIVLSISFFGLDIAVQTLAAMYVSSYTIKFIVEGINYKRTAIIITDQEKEVAQAINLKMNRGCTLIEGKGTFTENKRSVLYAVISVNQVAKVRMLVRSVDEHAFINIIESKVVFGQGKGFINITD